jgi:hypothetical protein
VRVKKGIIPAGHGVAPRSTWAVARSDAVEERARRRSSPDTVDPGRGGGKVDVDECAMGGRHGR